MHKILNSFFFLFLLTSQSQACMEPNYPDLDDLNKYESIYLAEVTSVYLESNENSLLFVHKYKKSVIQTWESSYYSMRAVVTEVLIGKEKNLLELSFDHCGTFLPELRSLGIFFVNSSGEVIPVYNNNGAHFVEALRAIEKFRH